jgi:outer membrane protein
LFEFCNRDCDVNATRILEIILSLVTSPSKFLLSLVVGAACFTGTSAAQEIKIAFLDDQRVMQESVPAKAAIAKIEQEFSKRDKELQDLSKILKQLTQRLDKDMPNLSDVQRLKRQRELADAELEFSRKQRAFNEDLSQRKNEELYSLSDRAKKIVRQIAEAEKIDLVLLDAVYFSPRIDITEKVLKQLAK